LSMLTSQIFATPLPCLGSLKQSKKRIELTWPLTSPLPL